MTQKPFCYVSLLAVFPKLPIRMRMELCLSSRELLKIHKREVSFSVHSIKMYQKREMYVGDDDEELGSPTGFLQVLFDSAGQIPVEYAFILNDDGKVNTLCSLGGKTGITRGRNALRQYFQHFVSKSRTPLKHIEIEEGFRPFDGFQNFTTPSLKWRENKANEPLIFTNFQPNHVFEKLELENIHLRVLMENQVKCAKHLIVRNSTPEFHDPMRIVSFIEPLQNRLIQIEFCLLDVDVFAHMCQSFYRHVRLSGDIGCSYTGKFFKREHPDLDEKVWKEVITTVNKNEIQIQTVGEGEEKYLLIEQNEKHAVKLFKNYHRRDCEEFTSFTIVKLPPSY